MKNSIKNLIFIFFSGAFLATICSFLLFHAQIERTLTEIDTSLSLAVCEVYEQTNDILLNESESSSVLTKRTVIDELIMIDKLLSIRDTFDSASQDNVRRIVRAYRTIYVRYFESDFEETSKFHLERLQNYLSVFADEENPSDSQAYRKQAWRLNQKIEAEENRELENLLLTISQSAGESGTFQPNGD